MVGVSLSRAIAIALLTGTLAFLTGTLASQNAGNRLTYLDDTANPYWVRGDTPKLVTPQWVGERGVEAVVVLSIDDMRQPAQYEAFLRPILDRLARLDRAAGRERGRAPVSIFTNFVDTKDPQLQKWLREGLSLEVHTVAHPCPCLGKRGFQWGKKTYDGCIDTLSRIPGARPVAFRMPCCDSMNSVSPRFFAEAFGKVTPAGNFLEIDSSVFVLLRTTDKRFDKYLPHTDASGRRNFVNVIEDYPYPYVIDKLCWQLPCSVPSDWEAQAVHGKNHPRSVADMMAAIDMTVAKQGVYTLVFHPHGWIQNTQIVQLIDHVVNQHGKKVAFLTMREVRDRLTQHLLAGQPLRAASGGDNGVRVLDVDADGFMDVVSQTAALRQTRIWQPATRSWRTVRNPGLPVDARLGFGVGPGNRTTLYVQGATELGLWYWTDDGWQSSTERVGKLHASARLRDVDHDGVCEFVREGGPFLRRLPKSVHMPDVRFVDIDRDGYEDAVFSNDEQFGVLLFDRDAKAFTRAEAVARRHGEGFELPPITRDGTNSGAWFSSDAMFVQNEHTGDVEPYHVRRIELTDIADWVRARHAATTRIHAGGGSLVPIGVARVDITPTHPTRLAGYAARKEETAKIAQRLFAKALVFGDGVDTLRTALVAVDNCGVPAPVVEAVAQRLEKSIGLARDRFVLTSTHTHSAPALRGYAPMLFDGPLPEPQQKHLDDYTDGLIDKLVGVVEAAARNTSPGRLAWAQGQVRFAANRRVVQNSVWRGFGLQPGGPVDHDLPVLRVTDANGKLRAIVANYACHCTGAGLHDGVCGDWAGYAQQYIEADHPGAVAMLTIGCGADANPNPRGSLQTTQVNGRAIATEVNKLLGGNFTSIEPKIRTTLRRVNLPFAQHPERSHWEKHAKQADSFGYHARENLKRLDRGGALPTHLDYPIATWSFDDDLLMVFLAGEVVVDYARYLRRSLDSRRLWVTGWANDVPCYIPSRRILSEGGYEADTSMVYYDKPTRFADAVESIILDAVKAQAPETFWSDNPRADTPSPRSPVEALGSMTLAADHAIELVASEPLVVDPVAFDWGPDGRLWVVEMRDYPTRKTGVPGGRVKVLTDTDGDGRYDQAAVFLDDLPYPTGVKVWRRGALVSAAPDILYAEDTDGDGRADVRRTLFTGFGEGNQQHRVNGLRWRLDNSLQVANGDSGGTIRSVQTGVAVNVRGRDLRIDPDTGFLDPQSGQTQFGTDRDDWGNWFGGDNSHPLWHYVLNDPYLRRNPRVAAPAARRVLAGVDPVFPTSRTLERFNDLHTANRFTSACSPMLYRDDLFGAEFAGSWFACEPVHNLVHRQVLKPSGVTFTTARPSGTEHSEFVTSSDNFFRPAMVRTGPDGAIWIADMYRFVIEHPTWIPPEWQRVLDLRAGADRGRIYRVFPKHSRPRPMPRLDRLDTRGLVAALDSPNGWQRDMAQQMLVWRSAAPSEMQVAVSALEAVVRAHRNPLARLHALYTLAGVGKLGDDILALALQDRVAGVRRHAIRLAEPRLASAAMLAEPVLGLVDDADPFVRMQLAYTLGEWRDQRAANALITLARRDARDPFQRAAILSSAGPHVGPLLVAMLAKSTATATREACVGPLLATLAASPDSATLPAVVRAVVGDVVGDASGKKDAAPQAWQLRAMRQLLDAAPRRAAQITAVAGPLFDAARAVVVDPRADTARRVAAVGLLGAPDASTLTGLLAARTPVELQLAVIARLGRLASVDVPALLLPGWAGHGPRLRQAILDLLLSRGPWAEALLDHAVDNAAFVRQIDPARRAALMGHRQESVRERSRELFGKARASSRDAVVTDYTARLRAQGAGDAGRGRAVFVAQCSVCHRVQGVGNDVGPDLAALTDLSPQSLLVAILDPNRAVEAKYTNYTVELRDGSVAIGMIVEETGASVTLRGLDGKATVIPRADIVEISSGGLSLMPEGLESQLGVGKVSDLIQYLRTLGPPPKRFPGNSPEVVQPDGKGVLTLPATQAAIYGTRLIFEPQYRNLGWWRRSDDHAVWTINTTKAGRYRVEFDFACHANDAGSSFILSVGSAQLTGVVPSTQTWDRYEKKAFGEIRLAGDVEAVTVRSVGTPRGALIDLRTVILTPIE